MSQPQCVSCAHLEERVSRRWYWCDKQSTWTSLATSCDEYAPLAGDEAGDVEGEPPPLPQYIRGRR